MENKTLKENIVSGERKRLSELKEGNLFVFTTRKKMPCIYNGTSYWKKDIIYLWSELKEHSCWTQYGDLWVIDYGKKLPDELKQKRDNYLMFK